MFGLAVVQINTLCDTLVAWLLARRPGGPESFEFLGWSIPYPMREGAAASIYFGDRVHQLPLGIFGIALGTVLFPMLGRHAARGEFDRLRADFTRAMRLVMVIGIPASVGLVLLASPLAELLFRHGEFTGDDAVRTARMIAAYGIGAWAYCAIQVLVRAFYAVNDRATPAKTGAMMVGLNVALNLTLIWPLAETGLALATSTCATLQALVLLWLLERRIGRWDHRQLLSVVGRTVFGTLVMAVTCLAALYVIPSGAGLALRAARLTASLSVGLLVYAFACWQLGLRELFDLVRRSE
jgi:putative peptidoglycan lipid II flippase